MQIKATYRRSQKRWEADPGEWTEYVSTGPTKREAIADAKARRDARAAHLRAARQTRRQLLDGLRRWLDGDLRYAPYVLMAWRRFTGYGNRNQCPTLAAWKDAVVEQMRWEAWRRGWENGWGFDPESRNSMDVWYAETPVGQISFHVRCCPYTIIPGNPDAQRRAETEAEAWLEMNRGTPYCNVIYVKMMREATALGMPKRICNKPHTRPWDGQRNVVAERLACLYGIECPTSDSDSDWMWALNRCGAPCWVDQYRSRFDDYYW